MFEMMKLYFSFIIFTLWFYKGKTAQPYISPQIVFSPNDGKMIIAIDQINQRAYTTYPTFNSTQLTSFVAKNFPNVTPNSPQTKHYVQLSERTGGDGCIYTTYWNYGGKYAANYFPNHWYNGTSFQIGNYLNYTYPMIHSNDSTSINEDFWYSNQTCQIDSGEFVPCEEIYFIKDTDIPLRFVRVTKIANKRIQYITNYTIISVGQSTDKYFKLIPSNWTETCRDGDLALFYPSYTRIISLQGTDTIPFSLSTPPHLNNGNDTALIQWKADGCIDCLTWTPQQIVFNSENFFKQQILTVTRIKNGPTTKLSIIIHGGGFDFDPTKTYYILIE